MALLPSKLIDRLNRFYELDYEFGTVLQQCLASIANNPPSGACITLPVYPDFATAEANCGAITGNIYWDSGNSAVSYYDGTQWISVNLQTLSTEVAGNTAKINLNCANLLTLTNQITMLTSDLASHNHNGINSPQIDIKTLTTTAPNGSYFFSNGSGIDCAPIVQGTKIELGGAIVSTDAICMDFSNVCFSVTQTAPGEVLVDIPKLPGILAATITNSTAIANNTSSITNISNTVAVINAQVTQNTTDITTLTNDFNTHTHDGTDSPQIPQENILSIVGGVAMPNNSIICADGAGGWQVFTKDFLNIPVGARNVGTLGIGTFDQINGTDSFLEFRNVAGACGISVTLDPNDNIIVENSLTGLADVGGSLDAANDRILIHSDSLGTCAQASIADIVASSASNTTVSGGSGISVVQTGDDYEVTNDHTFTAGKGITITKTAEDHEIDIDLDGLTQEVATNLDTANDFFTITRADGSCVKVPIDELTSTNSAALFRATGASNTLASGVATDIFFDTVDYDTDAAYNPATGEYTIPSDGIYRINAAWQRSPESGLTAPRIYVLVNGVEVSNTAPSASLSGAAEDLSIELTSGDVVKVQGLTTSGGAQLIDIPSTLFEVQQLTGIPNVAEATSDTLGITRKDTYQSKYQVVNAAANTGDPLPDLTFNNLVIGQRYQVYLQGKLQMTGAQNLVGVRIIHDGTDLTRIQYDDNETTGGRSLVASVWSEPFIATATTVTFTILAGTPTAGGTVNGNNTSNETYATLYERNNIDGPTTDYT